MWHQRQSASGLGAGDGPCECRDATKAGIHSQELTRLAAHHALALVARAVPKRPRLTYPLLRVVTFTGAAFTTGAEPHEIKGQRVKIYSVAKTIADLFKARHDVWLDVAIEALHDAWREGRIVQGFDGRTGAPRENLPGTPRDAPLPRDAWCMIQDFLPRRIRLA
jgi:hypothetical protein